MLLLVVGTFGIDVYIAHNNDKGCHCTATCNKSDKRKALKRITTCKRKTQRLAR